MAIAQIVSVETGEFGPTGPVKQIFAICLDEREAALEVIERRLKRCERARWLDQRSLSLEPGEVRRL